MSTEATTSREQALVLELEKITKERDRLKSWVDSAWARGHAVGTAAIRRSIRDADAVRDGYYADNAMLTNALDAAESQLATCQAEASALRLQMDELTRQCNEITRAAERSQAKVDELEYMKCICPNDGHSKGPWYYRKRAQ